MGMEGCLRAARENVPQQLPVGRCLPSWLPATTAHLPCLTFTPAPLTLSVFQAGGVKGALRYYPERKDAEGSVTVDKKLNGNDLTLKATYKLKGDEFTLQARRRRSRRFRLCDYD